MDCYDFGPPDPEALQEVLDSVQPNEEIFLGCVFPIDETPIEPEFQGSL